MKAESETPDHSSSPSSYNQGAAEFHFQFAMSLVNQGRLDEAATQFREALRLRPDAAEAWNNLGNVLFLDGKASEALPCYREALRLCPEYGEACLNLGNALREDDQLEEGLKWYREAVRLRPSLTKAHNNLAVALLELGWTAEAESHLRASLQYNPGSAEVLHILAANGLYGGVDPSPDELTIRIADPGLTPLERSQLHFTLAYLLERGGLGDEAFHHFRAGNVLGRDLARQAGMAFDQAEHSHRIDQLQAFFTPAYFQRVAKLGSPSEVPVFIVGMPRSGSSLVEQILCQHPDMAGVGELRDLPRVALSLPQLLGTAEPYPDCVAHLEPAYILQLANGYLNRVQSLVGVARRITDKMLDNFLHLGFIATLFPHARVIHCRRNPLDSCVSAYCQMFRNLSFTWDLSDLGHYYKEYERLMAHWRTALPLATLEVVYEELVTDLETGSRRLIDFCGLPWDDRCLRFYNNPRAVRTVSKLQVRQPIYRSSVGRWQRYAAHLQPLRAALGPELLQRESGKDIPR